MADELGRTVLANQLRQMRGQPGKVAIVHPPKDSDLEKLWEKGEWDELKHMGLYLYKGLPEGTFVFLSGPRTHRPSTEVAVDLLLLRGEPILLVGQGSVEDAIVSQIAEDVKLLVSHPRLKELVDYQVEVGIKKYGQTLDENNKPLDARIVHAIQEGVDMMQYLVWAVGKLESRGLEIEPWGPILAKNLKVMAAQVGNHLDYLVQVLAEDTPLTHKEGFKEGR